MDKTTWMDKGENLAFMVFQGLQDDFFHAQMPITQSHAKFPVGMPFVQICIERKAIGGFLYVARIIEKQDWVISLGCR
jgi:hypothetical protein